MKSFIETSKAKSQIAIVILLLLALVQLNSCKKDAVENTGKQITAFNFAALSPAVTGTITESSHTISLTVPDGTDVTTLVPTISISSGATVTPASGVAQDFTSSVVYTVKAQDGSAQGYTISVIVTNTPPTTTLNWKQLSINGNIYGLAVSGSNIFASNDAGVSLSSNSGTSWTSVSTGLPDLESVYAVAVSGTNVVAGVQNEGVYLSKNSGTSWTSVGPIGNVLCFGVSGNNIYAGTDGSQVYLSTDNGSTWASASTGLPSGAEAPLYSIAVSGANVFAVGYYGVFISTNSGGSWTLSSTFPDVSVTAIGITGTNIFAGTDADEDNGGNPIGGGVYISTDNGATWKQTGLTGNSVSCFAFSGSNIFAGSNNGVYVSTNNGTSWSPVGLADEIVLSLAISGSTIFAGTLADGVFKTSF